jgi:hypothetical protein
VHHRRLRQAVDRVVAALDVDVGADQVDQPHRGVLLEHHDVVDRAQRRQHRRAVPGRVDRAVGPLEAPYGLVGVEPDDQDVTERARLAQVLHMTTVDDVEATVGEHDAPTGQPVRSHHVQGQPVGHG